MYKDMLLKLIFHKEQIMKQFLKKGYFPKNDEINTALSQVDNRLALFKTYLFQPGELLNIKELNHGLEMIYKDLEFLYKILEEISIQEINKLNLYIETHMTYLEDLSKHFKQRAIEEINSTTLGTTLLFKSSNWDIETKDDSTIINLGDIELVQGSNIACFINANNVVNNSVKYSFTAHNDIYDFEALPYNYNNNIYKVPGDLDIKKHALKLDNNFIVSGAVNIPISNLNELNEYIVMGGKDLISVTYKDTNQTVLYPFPYADTPFYANESCYITFYISDGKEVEYNFNKKPLHTNFSLQNGLIQIDSDVHKVFLDVDSGFVCNFSIKDGAAWASKEEGIINGDKIVYNGNPNLRDFEIREYVRKNKTKYDINVTIQSQDDIVPLIESIYIKEM
jgi:hypothetical protein